MLYTLPLAGWIQRWLSLSFSVSRGMLRLMTTSSSQALFRASACARVRGKPWVGINTLYFTERWTIHTFLSFKDIFTLMILNDNWNCNNIHKKYRSRKYYVQSWCFFVCLVTSWKRNSNNWPLPVLYLPRCWLKSHCFLLTQNLWVDWTVVWRGLLFKRNPATLFANHKAEQARNCFNLFLGQTTPSAWYLIFGWVMPLYWRGLF